jgi:hypothetical protein
MNSKVTEFPKKTEWQDIYVYRNTQRECWSIISSGKAISFLPSKASKPTGKVAERSKQVLLYKAKFRVNEAGRRRVRKTGKKNVHAGVVGFNMPFDPSVHTIITRFKRKWTPVSYNPKRDKFFVDRNGRKILSAQYVWLDESGTCRVSHPVREKLCPTKTKKTTKKK